MTTELGPNPYVGPRPFREDEQQLLFGRRTELDELTDLLYAQRIVLLHSPSGAGKSSLVAAGLLPRLRKRFLVLPIMRVNQTPPEGEREVSRFSWSAMECLDSELRSVAADKLPTTQFAEYLAQRPRQPQAPARTVLVFDQFEEVLTVDPLGLDEKKKFFAELGEVLRDEKTWALFFIREDYLGALAQFAHLLPTGLQSRYRLGLLDRNAAREAITLPAQKAGRDFVPEASEQLIRDLATQSVQQPDGSFISQDGSFVEPVQLQVVCRRLWNRMSPDDRSVDLEDLVQLGNVSDALAEYYATSVAKIAGGDPVRERSIRAWVTDKLITPDGIRSQVLQGTDESDGLANDAIFALVNSHMVRAEKRRGATWFELAHDRLISPVKQNNEAWFESHLSELQRRAAAWDKQRRPAGLLLKGAELSEADDWSSAHGSQVTTVERELLVQSRREENKTKAVQFLTFVAVVVAAVALWLFFDANRARRAAELEKNTPTRRSENSQSRLA